MSSKEPKEKSKKKKVKKKKISALKRENNRITVVLGVICLLFISTIVYLSYFQMVEAEKTRANSANRRKMIEDEKTLRGSIYDRNGELLVHSEMTGDKSQKRIYDKPNDYSHIIGYNHKSYGNSGLEEQFNAELMGKPNESMSLVDTFTNMVDNTINPDKQRYGNDLKITIDDSLQSTAYGMLDGYRGSIIVMDTKSGEIYAMASNPTFNVADIDKDWNDIINNPESPLINRAISGLYPPGSIYKIITATGILESDEIDKDETYTSRGYITEDGYTLRDFDSIAYGPVDLKNAFRQSVNTYFAYMGLKLGQDKLVELEKRYLVGENIPFDLPVEKSRIQTKDMSKADIMATSIGQGKTLTTPMNMLLMTQAIANEGKMLKPVLVSEIDSRKLEKDKIKTSKLKDFKTEEISTVTTPEIANEIKDMMVSVVNDRGGTGNGAAIRNVTMAGKTGTAEVEGQESHAWFTGFAPAEDPKLAIVVMLENVGNTGGKTAAPIARDMMIEALNTLGV